MPGLEDERRKWRIEQQRRNEAAKQQRTQTRERREKFESHTDFILSHLAVDFIWGCPKIGISQSWQRFIFYLFFLGGRPFNLTERGTLKTPPMCPFFH